MATVCSGRKNYGMGLKLLSIWPPSSSI
ncbi:unnamed protein product [Staurois parvus]|uniref:Uncharacterized protein n=1 Tax=Staurois parvus TaxID=386267 RepID=A0ABN9G904_9NEOB|nr:unnamed protein product [Staurois parvus]